MASVVSLSCNSTTVGCSYMARLFVTWACRMYSVKHFFGISRYVFGMLAFILVPKILVFVFYIRLVSGLRVCYRFNIYYCLNLNKLSLIYYLGIYSC